VLMLIGCPCPNHTKQPLAQNAGTKYDGIYVATWHSNVTYAGLTVVNVPSRENLINGGIQRIIATHPLGSTGTIHIDVGEGKRLKQIYQQQMVVDHPGWKITFIDHTTHVTPRFC
jgi:hypothetical protein